eukprot:COSAG02_NODE_68360_length_249_cov_54.393333_1_plen_77_part_01
MHALTVIECHCHALSQSHGAKGPEIEPLAAGSSWHHVSCRCEARRIRQWSFAALVTLMGGRVCVCGLRCLRSGCCMR